MSRAFVKEDVEVPERSVRRRSASGLPPGALNFLTAHGAARLRKDADQRRAAGDEESAGEIERILESATIVEPSTDIAESVTFGTKVTVEREDGTTEVYRIVGVDEIELEPGCVSWVSPIGRALLGAECGSRVALGGEGTAVRIVKVEA